MAIKINGNTVIDDSQNFTSTGNISATGNIYGQNISGNISGNINAAGFNGAIQFKGPDGLLSANGNLAWDAGNLALYGYKVMCGNGGIGTNEGHFYIGNTNPHQIDMGGNCVIINIGNSTGTVYFAGTTSAAGNILTNAQVSASGNITGGNVNTSGVRNGAGSLTISTGSGNVNINPAGNLVLSGTLTNINNVAQPVQDQDAATKIYVDNLVSTAISYHQPVVAATTANLATTTGGTITYNNGTNGVGATITTTGSFNLIDSANVQSANTRILVKDEGNAVLNGVYVWSNATTITRSTDTDEYGAGNVNALGLNDYFFVSSGNVNKGSAYIVNAPTGTITFGTSNISFAQFSNSQTYTANTSAGITLVGTVITGKVDGITTAFDGGGNISVKASANLTTPNIGAATGTSLSTTGNVTGGNILTGGLISATSTITSAGNITGSNLLTGGLISSTGNVTGGNLLTGGSISAAGNIRASGFISAAGNVAGANLTTTGSIAGGNIAIAMTSGTISAGGNITGGNLSVGVGNITCGNIVNANGNGVGNIGSSSLYFNTVFAKATSAQYADLAEKYVADAEYAPGTVVQFGGSQEVTLCVADGCSRVAGVISTNPSYIMNGTLDAPHVATVALTGRVPTRVTGTVRKGDLMVSAGNGSARAEANPGVGTVIGKALADHDGAEGTIEVVVGRF